MEAFVFYAARWVHFLAGITWIGVLYYFNFIQAPFMAEAEAGAKPEITGKLLPRALWWFRWGAMFTFLSGLVMLAIDGGNLKGEWFNVPLGWGITVGALMAFIMFLNVWAVIWPKQQIVIASAAAVKAGGQANPAAAGAARRAFLASRTNTMLSIGMLFFMGAGRWLPVKPPDVVGKAIFGGTALLILALAEFNALTGDKGPLTKPLDSVKSVITAGFIIATILILAFVGGFGVP